jgi:hypothetical protein
MVDTVHNWLSMERAGNVDLLAHVPNHLQGATAHLKSNGGDYITGHLGNLNVSVGEAGISVKGSFPKFLFGDNFQLLTRQTTEEAIEKLSDLLGLPFKLAQVKRLDIAHSFMVKQESEAYFAYLGRCNHYSRLQQPHTLYYQNGQRVKLFYNKVEEGKRAGFTIPNVWEGKNVLRYELRYVRNLTKQFNRSEVTLDTLTNEAFYMGLIDQWAVEYANIKKQQLYNFDLSKMRNTKDFEKELLFKCLRTVGNEQQILEMIEQAKREGVFENKMQVKRIKDKVREVFHCPTVNTEKAELVEELDQKVKQVQRFYR